MEESFKTINTSIEFHRCIIKVSYDFHTLATCFNIE